jgi:hypothetical protein
LLQKWAFCSKDLANCVFVKGWEEIMNDEELTRWFDANKTLLETAYLAGTYPWHKHE